MNRFTATASPVYDLDRWPATHTFYVYAETTADAVDRAAHMLSSRAPGLAVRSVTPDTRSREQAPR